MVEAVTALVERAIDDVPILEFQDTDVLVALNSGCKFYHSCVLRGPLDCPDNLAWGCPHKDD